MNSDVVAWRSGALIRGRQRVLATFALSARLDTVELLAVAGFDAALFDLEHAPISLADLPAMSSACAGGGILSMVRARNHDPSTLSLILDCGIGGIVVPHVDSGDQARAIADACRYPPGGLRSFNPYVRSQGYGRPDASNDEPVLLAMIESGDGLKNVGEILATDGIDGIFVGPYDLAGSLGLPGQPDHGTVVASIERLFEAAATADKICGAYAHSADAARRWFGLGMTLVALSTDVALMAQALRDAVDQVRS